MVAINNRIANASLLCAMLVVSQHCGMPEHVHSASWWIMQVVSRIFAPVAVPYFFLVSGYFLARHINESGWWWREVAKRLVSLGIPYLIWNTMRVVHLWPMSIAADIKAGRAFGTSICCPTIVNWLGLDLTQAPPIYALWFLRWLLVLCLLSEMLVYLVRRGRYVFLLSLYVLSIFAYWACGWYQGDEAPITPFMSLVKWGASIEGMLYFSAGIAIRCGIISVPGRVLRFCLMALSVIMLCCQVIVLEYTNYSVRLFSFAVPFTLYFVWSLVPNRCWPFWLTGASFGIYCIQDVFLLYFPRYYYGPQGDWLPIWRCLIVTILSLFSIISIRRYSPRLSKILFGGR